MPRREFPAKTKVAAFARCGGKCDGCGAHLMPGRIEYDHIVPDALGGEPDLDNCAVLCRACHSAPGGKTAGDISAIARVKRLKAKHIGAAPKSRRPLSHPTLRRKMNGEVVPR